MTTGIPDRFLEITLNPEVLPHPLRHGMSRMAGRCHRTLLAARIGAYLHGEAGARLREGALAIGLCVLTLPAWASAQDVDANAPATVDVGPQRPIASAPVPIAEDARAGEDAAAPDDAGVVDPSEDMTSEGMPSESMPSDAVPSDAVPASDGMDFGFTATEDASEPVAPGQSPMRVSAAYEYGYKTQHPARTFKNRASLRLEYGKTFNGRFSAQFDAKANLFLGHDHRRANDDHDVMVSQAFLQTSIGSTSVRAGIQTVAWGESLVAPITDEISPRDNRELFNFNLEEVRVGQPMLVVDHFTGTQRWHAFVVPDPSFSKSPARGSIYFFDPFTYKPGVGGDGGPEYGASWKKSYDNADVTLMAASLIDNDYARRMEIDGEVSRLRQRYTLTGMTFTRAMGSIVLRGEAAVKFGKPFNDAALQIVRKRTIETYLGLDYQPTATLSFATELLNQHVSDWEPGMPGVARNRQTVMVSAQKNFWNDDLSISLQNFRFWPHPSNLTMLLATWTVNDNVTLSLNIAAPTTRHGDGSLWAVRDQKQTLFKIQWQF